LDFNEPQEQTPSVDNVNDKSEFVNVTNLNKSETVKVSNSNQSEVVDETHPVQSEQTEAVHILEPVHFSEDLHNGDVHLEVLAIPSGGRIPTPHQPKHGIQELSTSESWNFSPDEVSGNIRDKRNIGRNRQLIHRGDIVKPENYCFECIPDSMSTKVGRQAGRMPNRTQSATAQVLRMSRKQTEYFKRAPPIRTPPSIPSASHKQPHISEQSPRYGQTYSSELDHHARSTKSPRHYMEQGKDLSKVPNII
jgi:hypothetical protein